MNDNKPKFILTKHAIERFNHRFACFDIYEEIESVIKATSKHRKEIESKCQGELISNKYYVSKNNVFFICHDNTVLTVFEHVSLPTKRERNKRKLRYK